MIKVDNRQDLDEELNKNEKVMALFYATWCPYCTRFVPTFDKKIGNLTNNDRVIHVILDDYDSPLWDDYDIEAVPTIIYFIKGKVRNRLDGMFGVGLNETQFNVWLKKFNIS